MKKYLLFLAIPFAVLAETCEELKTQSISNIASAESLLTDNSRYIYYTYQNITSLQSTLDVLDQRTSGDPYVSTAKHQVSEILQGVQLVDQNENTISNYLSTTRFLLSSIDCSCDDSGTCPCDFSDIIQLLTSISSSASDSYIALQSHGLYLSQINDSLSRIEISLDSGFGAITNQLSLLGVITNQVSLLFSPSFSNKSSPVDGTRFLSYNNKYGFTSVPSWNPKFYGYLGSIYLETMYARSFISSLNNYAYYFRTRDYPSLTNKVVDIHRDQTNYFTFFRGEIGVQGVLSDWQSEQVSGTYHDFLTNHYLTVVRGGSLSGNQSSKTNWFSRIETLLAALVFTDSAETNTVDISSGNAERQQLATSYGTANQAAATFSEDFKTTSQSIVTLYQNYFTTFENAAMPSHVVLMRLSNSDPSEEIEISFQSDSLGVLVEACRVITTFCWASVGIFLLYKFLVWSARCVIVACQFIYRAISSVFRS